MSHQSELIATDIDAYLRQHERKELLRFLTCGNVDDGKSTLIGRLLHDSRMIYEDQLDAVRKDSARHGTTGGGIDLALLVDGLKAEREQGITIDVAYRYFSTARRKFIIADTPGHEQYTRNMVTGASTCDLAIILIDARHGISTQTRRHSFLVSLLGINHVIVAINKMDLVDWSADVFERIREEYTQFIAKLQIGDVRFIPLSALSGDNVVDPSPHMPWYRGSTLMHALETVHIASDRNFIDLRFPVQLVLRPNLDFRGFSGTVASGVLRPGDEVMVLPSRRTSRVSRIVTFEGDVAQAFSPMAVTVTLEDEVDVSRGDMLVAPANQPLVRDAFDAMVVWMNEAPLVPGRSYLLKHTTRTVTASVESIRYRIDVNTLHRTEAAQLGLNEIGRCLVRTHAPLSIDPYARNHTTGSFILIDRLTNATVAAGMIGEQVGEETVRGESAPVSHWETEPASERLVETPTRVSLDARTRRHGHAPATVLLTGLPGSGKTTLASLLEQRLFDLGCSVSVLDGQSLRLGISRDLGFSSEDRSENLRRGAEVARLFNAAGMIVLAAFVAPSEEARSRAAGVVGAQRFLLIHLDPPETIRTARSADDGSASVQMRRGGEDPVYERPRDADLRLDTAAISPQACVDQIVDLLRTRGILRS